MPPCADVWKKGLAWKPGPGYWKGIWLLNLEILIDVVVCSLKKGLFCLFVCLFVMFAPLLEPMVPFWADTLKVHR